MSAWDVTGVAVRSSAWLGVAVISDWVCYLVFGLLLMLPVLLVLLRVERTKQALALSAGSAVASMLAIALIVGGRMGLIVPESRAMKSTPIQAPTTRQQTMHEIQSKLGRTADATRQSARGGAALAVSAPDAVLHATTPDADQARLALPAQ